MSHFYFLKLTNWKSEGSTVSVGPCVGPHFWGRDSSASPSPLAIVSPLPPAALLEQFRSQPPESRYGTPIFAVDRSFSPGVPVFLCLPAVCGTVESRRDSHLRTV